MQLGMVGLGRMGSNMVRRLIGAGHVAYAGGSLDVSGIVVGVVTQLFHQRDVDGIRVDWENIAEGPKGGVADRAFFVGFDPFAGWSPQRSVQSGPVGAVVVGGPGVVHASLHDRQGSRNHRCAELRIAHSL